MLALLSGVLFNKHLLLFKGFVNLGHWVGMMLELEQHVQGGQSVRIVEPDPGRNILQPAWLTGSKRGVKKLSPPFPLF